MEKQTESCEEDNQTGKRRLWSWLKGLVRKKGAPDTTEELEQEIQELLGEGEEQGLISRDEERLINSIFDFRETVASEIMTPSADMVSADIRSTTADLIHLITNKGYTRIPIYETTPDNIVGILHAKDLLRICSLGNDAIDLRKYIKPPIFIPENKLITELLRDFQANKTHMAIVTDEFGGVRGLVTLEDVIEEIVGEIDDEYDREERELMIVDQQTVVVDAKIDIEEVERHFCCTLPDGPYESVGGLILHRLGRLPRNGITVHIGDLTFTVLSCDSRRIKTVRIRKTG